MNIKTPLTCCLILAMGMAALAVAEEELVELEFELPRPMFVGTPTNIVSDNLCPDTGTPRSAGEPFKAPRGVENVALFKPVSASDEDPIIGDLDMITDGDKEGADGSFVEFGPGVQWVQIDLEDKYEIFAILLWHYHSQARIYHDVIVRVSDDKDFITYKEVFSNDHDNSAKLGIGRDYEYIETNEGRLMEVEGAKARYVRLYSNGNTSNDMNHVIEVEVWGRPVS